MFLFAEMTALTRESHKTVLTDARRDLTMPIAAFPDAQARTVPVLASRLLSIRTPIRSVVRASDHLLNAIAEGSMQAQAKRNRCAGRRRSSGKL